MPVWVRPAPALLLAVAMALASPALAVPDLATRRPVGPLLVFNDDRRADLFYYAPPELAIAKESDGRPAFSFLETRYSGSVVSRSRGLVLHRSLLTFRILLPPYRQDQLAAAARTLRVNGRLAELRPLPIRRLESAVVYAAIGSAPDTTAHVVPGGHFEGAADDKPHEGYWTERTFTIGVDSLTAQAMRAALEAGQLAISLGYAFIADGQVAAEPWGDLDGTPALVEQLRTQIAYSPRPVSAGRDSAARRVVRAGAIRVGIDAKRWPDLMKRVDIDDHAPPGYAALDVYCYDFRDSRRPDLYEESVDVEAESATGRPVRLRTVFARSNPDVYAMSLRFPVAVRLDRPYRYRVVQLHQDGLETTGPWIERRDWVQLLDVTTPASSTPQGVRAIR